MLSPVSESGSGGGWDGGLPGDGDGGFVAFESEAAEFFQNEGRAFVADIGNAGGGGRFFKQTPTRCRYS